MAELYLCRLLGETRAAVCEQGRLVEMHLRRDGDGLAAGARVEARLVRKLGKRGIALAGEGAGDEEILLEPWPQQATEGERRTVEISRAAWKEPGRERLAKARPTAMPAAAGADLQSRLAGRGFRQMPGWPDWLAAAFDDAFDEARLGLVRFPGGRLSLTPTPALLAVDVDGEGDDLQRPALLALARAIRLYGLGGNIVVDLPASPDRKARLAAAEAFDKAMGDLAFERTAVNGFGLLQLIRPRPGPSILERARLDQAGTLAVQLLNQALADRGTAPAILDGPPAALAWIGRRPHLLDQLCRQSHRSFTLAGRTPNAEPA